MSKILVLHPYKPIMPPPHNGLSAEMLVLGDLVADEEDTVEYVGKYQNQNLADYDTIWCSCFKFQGHNRYTSQMAIHPDVRYFVNDPAFAEPPVGFKFSEIATCWGRHPDVPVWQYQFIHQQILNSPAGAPPFDFIYAGRNRTPERQANVERLLNGTLCIAGDIDLDIEHTKLGLFGADQIVTLMNELAYATIVTGCPDYNKILPYPHRLLQGIAANVLTFIDKEMVRGLPIRMMPYSPYTLLGRWMYVTDGAEANHNLSLIKADPVLKATLLVYQRAFLKTVYKLTR